MMAVAMARVGGGLHPRACRDSLSSGQDEWEEKRKKGGQINKEQWPRAEERSREWMEMTGGTGRPVWIVLSGDTEDTAGRVGGCQSGKGASSLSSLFHALAPLFSLLPPPSFHASVLLFLAPRGSTAMANKQTRLFIPAGGE